MTANLDPALYKTHETSRGYTYSYYHSAPTDSKPTLVFLHGFPSTSNDWRHQVAYFKTKGYGLIVPDMLGYGGTDKPLEVKAYVGSGLAKDIVDLMDGEGVESAVCVAHDWGCRVASRLANFYPARFTAFAFFAVGYSPPNAVANWTQTNQMIKGLLKRDITGYQTWFSEDDTAKVLEDKFDSFFSLLFPSDSKVWAEHLGPTGAAKAWIESGKQTPLPSYITEEDKEYIKKAFVNGGFEAPTYWYKVMTSDAVVEDDKQIPKEAYFINQPVFFGAAVQDHLCLPALFDRGFQQFAKGPVTRIEFAADHWVILSHAKEVNEKLEAWVEGL